MLSNSDPNAVRAGQLLHLRGTTHLDNTPPDKSSANQPSDR